MSGYTALGSRLWVWQPFVQLAPLPRVLWLALYTSVDAKLLPPGLFTGGIHRMAEAARLSSDDTTKGLDELLQAEVVEYDTKNRVLRLMAPEGHTPLPDTGEWPHNPNHVKSWWTRFQSVAPCAVRDAHVTTLKWLLETGARDRGKPLTELHRKAWNDSFGHVQIPPQRRRGVRRLLDEDTSTAVQPSLFASPSEVASRYGARSEPSALEQRCPEQIPSDASSSMLSRTGNADELSTGGVFGVRNSGTETNQISGNGSRTVRDTDRDSVSFSSHGKRGDPPSEPPGRPCTERVADTGAVLRSVPPPAFSVDQALQEIATDALGLFPLAAPESRRAALQRVFASSEGASITPRDLRVLGRFIGAHPTAAAGWMAWMDRGGLRDCIDASREWERTQPPMPAGSAPDPDTPLPEAARTGDEISPDILNTTAAAVME